MEQLNHFAKSTIGGSFHVLVNVLALWRKRQESHNFRSIKLTIGFSGNQNIVELGKL